MPEIRPVKRQAINSLSRRQTAPACRGGWLVPTRVGHALAALLVFVDFLEIGVDDLFIAGTRGAAGCTGLGLRTGFALRGLWPFNWLPQRSLRLRHGVG